jgi:ribosomal protein L16 Arg81 hydroxylase
MNLTTETPHGLPFLLGSTDISHFMAEVWLRRTLFLPRVDVASDPLVSHLSTCSVKALLRMSSGPVIVMHQSAGGEYLGTAVAADPAFDFYSSGCALYFDLSERHAEVAAWINALARDLGQRPSDIRVSIFASPKNGKTECHFDANENFTIQLRGVKRWRMAPNDFVAHPIDRFTMSRQKPSAMALYVENDLRSRPRLVEVADLEPGSMLYVPRGCWHEVEALEPSISVNFCVKPETWLSYLLPLIERRLHAESAWREGTFGVRGDEAGREAARMKIGQLFDDLPGILAEMTAQEIVPRAPTATRANNRLDHTTRLRRNRTALLQCSTPDEAKGAWLQVRVDLPNTVLSWKADVALAPVCLWVASQPVLTAGEILEKFRELPSHDVVRLLDGLVTAGFLSVEPT